MVNYHPYKKESKPLPPRKPTVNYLRIDELAPFKKQQLWSGIRRTNQELATLIKDDPFLKQLRAEFDAELVLPEEEVNRYIANCKKG